MNCDMKNNPLISIVVIGYNVENVIRKCLDSIIKQTYRKIEIIVVDDGSNDSTADIVKSMGKDDNRICLITQKNQGILPARKTGLKNANGQFVVFVDSDDWLSENLVNRLYECVTNDSILDIVVSDNVTVYENKEVMSNYNRCKFDYIYKDYDYLELILNQKVVHNVFGKLYRTDFLRKSNYLDIQNISMGEDLLAQVVLGINKPNVIIIDENLYYYVQDSQSYSHNSSSKIFELIDVLGFIEEYLKKDELNEKYKIEIQLLWFIICYFYYVVSISGRSYRHKKHFYDNWRLKKIKINENNLIKEYIKTLSRTNRILLTCYNFNFTIGFCANKVILTSLKMKNLIKR